MLKLGTAWRDVTPDRPLDLMGQMHIRKGQFARDPLTVNAAWFEQNGRRLVLLSVDICVLTNSLVRRIREAIAQTGLLSPQELFIAATHTHVAPVVPDAGILPGEVDEPWIEQLIRGIVETIQAAAADVEPVTLWSGDGQVDLGWNRRGYHRDGSVDMYHGSWKPDFSGIEGPRDTHIGVIWATREDRSIKLITFSFASHCNALSSGNFYSADLPGEVRKVLRYALGEKTGVLYFTGAAGDIDTVVMENNPANAQPWRGEQGIKSAGGYLGGEILRVIASTFKPMANQEIASTRRTFSAATRVWDAHFDPEKLAPGGMRDYCVTSRNDWDRLLREEPESVIEVAAVRLGDGVICFNPAELYCQFGLAIKSASPAKTTVVAQLAHGTCGYIPTPQAILHGGYSARSSNHTRCAPDTGWRIVDHTAELLKELF